MRRRWFIAVLAGCGLAVVIAIVALTFDREPRYKGRSLSRWLKIEREAMSTNVAGNPEAEDAVRHIGTNALPYLIKWVDYENGWRTKLGYRISNLPRSYRPTFVLRALDSGRQATALSGFWILRADASPAIPELQRLASQSKPPAYINRRLAALCLGNIGSAAQPALSKLMNDPDPGISAAAKAAYLQTLKDLPDSDR